jgi:hypothetical protein
MMKKILVFLILLYFAHLQVLAQSTSHLGDVTANSMKVTNGISEKGTFNVLNYGAKGDSATDNTTFIQNTINAANSVGGGIVYIPSGTYITTNLSVPSNITFKGDGVNSKIKLKNATNTPIFTLIGVSKITFKDFVIDGNSTNQTGGIESGIQGWGADSILVENCILKNTTECAIEIRNSHGPISIINNEFYNTGWLNNQSVAIWLPGYQNTICENIKISGNTIDGRGHNTGGISIQPCDSADGGNNTSTSITKNIVVSNNIIWIGDPGAGKDELGIELWSRNGGKVSNASITGNVIRGENHNNGAVLMAISTAGGRSENSVENVIISGNSIYDCQTTAIELIGSNLSAVGNVMRNSGDLCIVSLTAPLVNCSIIGNTIDSCANPNYCIRLTADSADVINAKVTDNIINASGSTCPIIGGDGGPSGRGNNYTFYNLEVSRNKIYAPTFNGIVLASNHVGTVIKDNVIDFANAADSGQAGIYSMMRSSNRLVISGNIIHNAKSYGLYFNVDAGTHPHRDVVIDRNIIDTSAGHGIFVSGISRLQFTNNVFNSVALYTGSEDSCGEVSVWGNILRNCAQPLSFGGTVAFQPFHIAGPLQAGAGIPDSTLTTTGGAHFFGGLKVDGNVTAANIGGGMDAANFDDSLRSQTKAYNVLSYGAIADSSTNVATAIMRADTAAYPNGIVVIPPGVYVATGPIYLRTSLQAGDAKIYTSDTTKTLINWGNSGITYSKTVYFPEVHQRTHTTGGGWGSDIGILIRNSNSGKFYFRQSENFGTGIKIIADAGIGTVFNEFYLGRIINNKKALHLQPLAGTGWVNENLFVGGNFQGYGSEPDTVIGARSVLIDSAQQMVNKNTFLKPSFEDNAPEYTIECYGLLNSFIDARFEITNPKIKFGSLSVSNYATGNTFKGGSGLENIKWLHSPSEEGENSYDSPDGPSVRFSSTTMGNMILRNGGSSSYPAITIVNAEDTLATPSAYTNTWRVKIGANLIQGKLLAETYPRWGFDNSNGALYFGDGSSAFNSNAYLGGAGSDLLFFRGRLGVGYWTADSTLTVTGGAHVTQGLKVDGMTTGKFVSTTVTIADSTVNWSAGNSFKKTLSANQRFLFANLADGQMVNVAITNTASNYTVTWVDAVTWKDGITPTQTTGAKTDIYTFWRIGSTTYGSASQNY